MISENREDYLRAIYCIAEQNNKNVRSIDIVKYLQVSKPAVSEMLNKLKNQKYITKDALKISFTNNGLKEAEKLTYKHRISELFLRDFLNIEEKDIHKEAHKFEHMLSDKVAKKMAVLLGNPQICPCGHEIPNID
jgi:DtxR family Mn-dependent transcriptional regulator